MTPVMNKMRRISLSIFLIVFFNQIVFAQYDPRALAILDNMSNKYQNIGAYLANFTYALQNEQEGISESFDGTLLVDGDKFRLIMAGQEIYCNGTTVWTYIEEINEVNIDNYYPDEMEMSPSNIYSAYKKGYKYQYIEEVKKNGNTTQIVDLVPEDSGSPFFKIRLSIGKENLNLNGWEIFDKNGNRYNYTVKTFQNKSIKDPKEFEFEVKRYPGVEVIDLR
jgi:outer membrane lipoprotein carrier protein